MRGFSEVSGYANGAQARQSVAIIAVEQRGAGRALTSISHSAQRAVSGTT
ncbi:MAG: hypothetical protein QOC89_2139 [Paraburkholderia sp.]|jgi:hypothetical protein|nr:hypothetical protein [Paraburkholderia sp.]